MELIVGQSFEERCAMWFALEEERVCLIGEK